jgi:predicted membrane protein
MEVVAILVFLYVLFHSLNAFSLHNNQLAFNSPLIIHFITLFHNFLSIWLYLYTQQIIDTNENEKSKHTLTNQKKKKDSN